MEPVLPVHPLAVAADAPLPPVYLGNHTELIEGEMLKRHSLAINSKYHLICCIRDECGCALTKNWLTHVKSHYRNTGLKVTSEEEVCRHFSSCHFSFCF